MWAYNGMDDSGVHGRHRAVFEREEVRVLCGTCTVGTVFGRDSPLGEDYKAGALGIEDGVCAVGDGDTAEQEDRCMAHDGTL